jgi:lysyl-tRNA synthetase class 2
MADNPKTPAAPAVPVDPNEQTRVRREKLEKLRAEKRAYPHGVKVTHTAAGILGRFPQILPAPSKEAPSPDAAEVEAYGTVSIAGRVGFVRSFGKAGFVKVRDRSGTIQVHVAKDKTEAQGFADFETLDLGDIVRAEGRLFRTKTGELTVEAKTFTVLSKCLHAPPEKFHGLADIEERYRRRYVDLFTSEESRRTFEIRSKVVKGVRDYFAARDFLEVETPMMHPLVSGATAKPFVTHHNALDRKLFLRIAPELYLKRLVVGGMERVFEINRNFRNEGISTRHNPEFTMLEFYMAYATYHDLMDMTEELIEGLAKDIHGKTTLSYQGKDINVARPWTRISMENAVLTMSGFKGKLQDANAMRSYLKERGAKLTGREGPGALLTMIFEEDVEKQLIQPTFITGYPVEVSPLARRADEPSPQGFDVTERFEFFVNGTEFGNGFNELNDPDDQAARFHAQLKEKDAGNDEATDFDADYIQALEYGLPPTAGEGIGIDRLAMLMTDSASIRDVILFPIMRD